MVRQLPQPFKTLYASGFIVLVIGCIAVAVVGAGSDVRFVVLLFGLLAAAQGAVLALDLRHNATEVSRLMRTTKPLGVDYSNRAMGSVPATRLVGAGEVVVGSRWRSARSSARGHDRRSAAPPDAAPVTPSRPAPRRLVTSVVPAPEVALQPEHQLSARALLELELADGQRVVLLDDRGWTSSTGRGRSIWASTTREALEETARTVVGPDEPVHGGTWEQAVASSWQHLADVASAAAVAVSGAELAALPHDVVVDETLLAGLSGPPGT